MNTLIKSKMKINNKQLRSYMHHHSRLRYPFNEFIKIMHNDFDMSWMNKKLEERIRHEYNYMVFFYNERRNKYVSFK